MLNIAAVIVCFISLQILDILFITFGVLGFRYAFVDFTPPEIPLPPSALDLILFGLIDPLIFQPLAFIAGALALTITLKAFPKADPPGVTFGLFLLVVGDVVLSPWIFPGSDFKLLMIKLPAWLLGLSVVGLSFSKLLTPLRAFLSMTAKGVVLAWLVITTAVVSSFEIKPLEVNPDLKTFEEVRREMEQNGTLGHTSPKEESPPEEDGAEE
jgi:hypothetical protein